ncbi:HNH endonuclease signature motif containing protein, partial [Microbacterium azadirachtae]|uniref:HNH endonuclease signature motif containing protein n=3 Tax=Microbacterium azadirachtae TaxID=582680 RepID=UPI00089F3BAB
ERVLTHPVTGGVLAVDRYRPGADLRRLLHARDARCRFPTCGLPPSAHDLDHTIDAAHGGPTDAGNLAGLCRRHHVLKHHTSWTVTQRGAGILEWTSPTGRTYIDTPPAPVTFTTTDPYPPPEHRPPF